MGSNVLSGVGDGGTGMVVSEGLGEGLLDEKTVVGCGCGDFTGGYSRVDLGTGHTTGGLCVCLVVTPPNRSVPPGKGCSLVMPLSSAAYQPSPNPTNAVETNANAIVCFLFIEPLGRIERPSTHYKCAALPLCYRGEATFR